MDQPTAEAVEETLVAILMADRLPCLATAPCREARRVGEAQETLVSYPEALPIAEETLVDRQ